MKETKGVVARINLQQDKVKLREAAATAARINFA